MPRKTFLGLDMDATMIPKIITALRGLYPNLVSPNDSDNRVVQLVLHQIITEHVAAWAARSATPPITQIVQQAQDTALATQEAAEQVARTDAADIVPTALS